MEVVISLATEIVWTYDCYDFYKALILFDDGDAASLFLAQILNVTI